MKYLKLIAALLATGGFIFLTGQVAIAGTGASITGGSGGQIENPNACDGKECEVSFTFGDDGATDLPSGTLQVVFHNTSDTDINKDTFTGTVAELDRFTDHDCTNLASYGIPKVKVANVIAIGTLTGHSGQYYVLIHLGDSGTRGNWGDLSTNYDHGDTVRIELRPYDGSYDSDASYTVSEADVYDTSTSIGGDRGGANASGDFPNNSQCYGYTRTYLTKGDVTINP